MCQYKNTKEIVFHLREYLTMNPDGEIMEKCRQNNWFPFSMDYWPEEKCLDYLKYNREFILQALEDPDEKDDKEWPEKLKYDLK